MTYTCLSPNQECSELVQLVRQLVRSGYETQSVLFYNRRLFNLHPQIQRLLIDGLGADEHDADAVRAVFLAALDSHSGQVPAANVSRALVAAYGRLPEGNQAEIRQAVSRRLCVGSWRHAGEIVPGGVVARLADPAVMRVLAKTTGSLDAEFRCVGVNLLEQLARCMATCPFSSVRLLVDPERDASEAFEDGLGTPTVILSLPWVTDMASRLRLPVASVFTIAFLQGFAWAMYVHAPDADGLVNQPADDGFLALAIQLYVWHAVNHDQDLLAAFDALTDAMHPRFQAFRALRDLRLLEFNGFLAETRLRKGEPVTIQEAVARWPELR